MKRKIDSIEDVDVPISKHQKIVLCIPTDVWFCHIFEFLKKSEFRQLRLVNKEFQSECFRRIINCKKHKWLYGYLESGSETFINEFLNSDQFLMFDAVKTIEAYSRIFKRLKNLELAFKLVSERPHIHFDKKEVESLATRAAKFKNNEFLIYILNIYDVIFVSIDYHNDISFDYIIRILKEVKNQKTIHYYAKKFTSIQIVEAYSVHGVFKKHIKACFETVFNVVLQYRRQNYVEVLLNDFKKTNEDYNQALNRYDSWHDPTDGLWTLIEHEGFVIEFKHLIMALQYVSSSPIVKYLLDNNKVDFSTFELKRTQYINIPLAKLSDNLLKHPNFVPTDQFVDFVVCNYIFRNWEANPKIMRCAIDLIPAEYFKRNLDIKMILEKLDVKF
jgi:hypothetical protein